MRRKRDAEVESLWAAHMAEPFLVDYVEDQDAEWTELDWAHWDGWLAGHIVTYLDQRELDAERLRSVRELVNEGLRWLPTMPAGVGRTQMTRMCFIGTLLLDESRND